MQKNSPEVKCKSAIEVVKSTAAKCFLIVMSRASFWALIKKYQRSSYFLECGMCRKFTYILNCWLQLDSSFILIC
jgi:hypothetical protein